MIEGRLPDIEQTQPEATAFPHQDGYPQPAPEPAPAPRTKNVSRKKRGAGRAIFTTLGRLWIPLVIIGVIIAGGLTVTRLHGVFGSENSLAYGDTKNQKGKDYNPKMMKYEIFGPPGTVAQISYFDVNGDPKHLDATLPWSEEFPISAAAGIGSIAAQGNSSEIGCRILVDGVVKAEKVETHEISTFVSCLLKAA